MRHILVVVLLSVLVTGCRAPTETVEELSSPAPTTVNTPALPTSTATIRPSPALNPPVFTTTPLDTLPPSLTPRPLTATPGPVTLADEEQARAALLQFFSYLHAGQYHQADDLYGGDHQFLIDYNPGVPPDDYRTLWEHGCQENGLQCLEIRRVVSSGLTSNEFRFVVEFTANDGALFVRGPCCGASETDTPPLSQFTYTVVMTDGQFVVRQGPIYVP